MKYYVYTHKLNGEIIYVGKGTRNRAYRFYRRSELWKTIVGDKQDLIKADIVAWFDDEMEAFEYESKLTAQYKSMGLCRANITVGTKLTENTKRIISEKLKGESNGMYGIRGGDHYFAKPIIAIFPNGRRIETASQKEMTAILEREYKMTERMVKHIIETERPYNPRFKQHKELKGLVLKYSS